jgi:4-amino-4-deoxy-L-arabinose transferase-like glycosyltransferase
MKDIYHKFLTQKHILILMLILFIALSLRLWGINFGLPHLYHTDEPKEVVRALQLGAGSFNFSRIGKGGYFYLLFFEYAVYFLILKISGAVTTGADFARLYFTDPSGFYLIGRITTALIGVLNVFVLYLLGKKVYGARAGMLGAIFLAVNFLHVQSSHYVTVDVPMTCFVTITLLFAIQMVRTGKLLYYALGFFFASCAIITKIPAAVVLVSLLIAHFFVAKKDEKWIKEFFFSKNLIIVLFVFVIILIIGNPGILLNYKYITNFVLITFFGKSRELVEGAALISREPVNQWLYYFAALKESMGLPLLVISAVGLGFGLYKHDKEDVILISFCLIYFFLLCISTDTKHVYARYIIPILPILALMSARLIDDVIQRPIFKKRRYLSIILICAVLVQPLFNIVSENYFISHKDTRTSAKEWIEKYIPENSTILIEGSRTFVSALTAPLKNSEENIMKNMLFYKANESTKAKYLEWYLKFLNGKTYDLVTIGDHEIVKGLDYYKRQGVEYIVWRPEDPNIQRSANYKRLAEQLYGDQDIVLIKKIEGNKFNKPGPTIEIYHVQSNFG